MSLPKGGGAIRGIGEKFAANPGTGTGSMTVPLAISPGRSGFGPQLALSYDSGSGNGLFGIGWNLTLLAITRKTDKGLPLYLDIEAESDVFLLSGSEDLVPVLELRDGGWNRTAIDRTVAGEAFVVHSYGSRIEGLFARIERWIRKQDGDTHWRSISRDNVTTNLAALFSLRHDFRTEWSKYLNGNDDFSVQIRRDHFHYFAKNRKITVPAFDLYGANVTDHHSFARPAATLDLTGPQNFTFHGRTGRRIAAVS